MADLLRQLGNIRPERVLLNPPPGTATEADIVRLDRHTDRRAELVDGVLVEKAMGYVESAVAMAIIQYLYAFVEKEDLGVVTGESGMMRLFHGLVRIPDVAFASWERIGADEVPDTAVADFGPELAVEVLSKGNTVAEMSRKRQEYFRAGAKQVWLVDPRKRTVRVYTDPESFVVLTDRQKLTGGDLLPGFSVPINRIFDVTKRKKPK